MFLSVKTDNVLSVPTRENIVEHPFEYDELDEFIAEQSNDPEFLHALRDAETRSVLRRQLISARKAMGLTQSDVAKCMETTQSAVSDFEHGETDPHLSTFQRYARAVCGELILRFAQPTTRIHTDIAPTRWNEHASALTVTAASCMNIASVEIDFRTQFDQPPSRPSLTTSELIGKGGRIASNCELLDVRPTRLAAELTGTPTGDCDVNVAIAPSCRLDDRNGQVIYETDFTVNVASDEQTVAVFNARFVATFQLAEGFTAGQEEYLAFGDVTVLMSMVPYLREYVHTTASRLGLNGVVLGLIRQPAAITLQAQDPVKVPKTSKKQPAGPPLDKARTKSKKGES
jgi:transcriptional regulator with XRE-family HTH domain/RNase P/RNase MRP subunit p29